MLFFVLISIPPALLVALILIQAVFVCRYRRHLLIDLESERDRTYQPAVTIVLCLRGNDPFLRDCIEALLNQNYADYRLVCVFDSESDPAWSVVRRFDADSRLSMTVASPQGDRRSLKCNSLLHAFRSIERAITVLVDADTIVDPDWLVDLVAPLAEDNVVASSGNRWFVPPRRDLGSQVRSLWNMAAAPQMHAYQITWGGSLALKTDFVRESELLELWSKSLFEDAAVSGVARDQGKRVCMIPGLLIPNHESISLAGAKGWIQRQLLDTRLYHRCFPAVVGHAFGVAFAILSTIGVLVLMLVKQEGWVFASLLTAALSSYVLFYYWSWKQLDTLSTIALRRRGHVVENSTIGFFGWMAIGVTQWVYTMSTAKALWTKRVEWRGIEYTIKTPFEIEMIEYCEMKAETTARTKSL